MATQSLMDELDDGVHDVEMTIEIDFKFPQGIQKYIVSCGPLTQARTEDPSQKSQFKFGGKGPKPTKVRDRFAVIYELPNGNEVRVRLSLCIYGNQVSHWRAVGLHQQDESPLGRQADLSCGHGMRNDFY